MRSFPIWQSRSSCGGAPVGKELPRRWQLANPKWYVRSVTLSFVHAVPARVADDFEARAVAIGKLSLKVAEKRKALDDINERLETIRKQWEPRVEDLVTSIDKAFGRNFAQITCAGEVKLRKDDDFSKWAIDIRVRFR